MASDVPIIVWPSSYSRCGVANYGCKDSMVLAFYGVVQCGVKRSLKRIMQYCNLIIKKLYELVANKMGHKCTCCTHIEICILSATIFVNIAFCNHQF